LSHPKFEHEKSYWAQVEGSPTEDALEPLRRGVQIQDYVTKPCRVRVLTERPNFPEREPPVRFRKSIPDAWIEINLREGKNRQVRRMTASVGFPTLRLVRVAIGGCRLGDLAAGSWRELASDELQT
jgi:23S rRNA pseudouridine2457 synthase